MNFISTLKPNIRKGLLAAAGVVAGSLLLTGCMDDIESPELQPAAYVSIFQGATDAPAMNIFANQNRVNQNPLEYAQVLPYSPYYPGTRDFRFSAFNSATSLLEKDLVLKVDSVYSIFVVDAGAGIDAILAEDIWAQPTADSTQLRFVHLSPDAENVYLEISGSTDPLIEGATFKSVSDFEKLTPGNFTLKVKSTANDEVLIQSGTLELKGNRVYTLILRGLEAESSGTKKLDLQLITNFVNY
jgi:hypothetical protein